MLDAFKLPLKKWPWLIEHLPWFSPEKRELLRECCSGLLGKNHDSEACYADHCPEDFSKFIMFKVSINSGTETLALYDVAYACPNHELVIPEEDIEKKQALLSEVDGHLIGVKNKIMFANFRFRSGKGPWCIHHSRYWFVPKGSEQSQLFSSFL